MGIIAVILLVSIILVAVFACLVVGSDYDDACEAQRKAMDREKEPINKSE